MCIRDRYVALQGDVPAKEWAQHRLEQLGPPRAQRRAVVHEAHDEHLWDAGNVVRERGR